MSHPEALENPFFLMTPEWLLVPLVLLATSVTVIASQAVITGAYSTAQQAISLGLLPRMTIKHTNETEHGQIYISEVNWLLLFGVIMLVLMFRSSSNLAAAYGVAVNTTMIVVTMLALIYFSRTNIFPKYIVLPCLSLILGLELVFLLANGLKIAHGGYVPILIGAALILIMVTWRKGRGMLARKLNVESVKLEGLLASMEKRPLTRVAGAAVFLQTDPAFAPSALMHNLKHNRILHDILIFVSAETSSEPRVEHTNRVTVERLPLGAWRVKAHFGYMEQPDVPAALRACESYGLVVDPSQASYFLGRRVIQESKRAKMPIWQQRIFIVLTNQSARAIEFFRIPPDRVVELGMQMSV